MYKIGITGGISSGKTTASNFFKKKGAYIFNADQESKKHLKSSISLQHKLIDSFGSSATEGNKLSLVKLAKIAFSSKLNQDILNGIMWPEVYILVHNQLIDAEKEGYDIFVVDAALIYETGFEIHMDYVVVVTSRLKLRTERALIAGKLKRDDFLKRESIIEVTKTGIARLGSSVINLAEYENLHAHANSIKIRMKKGKN